MSIEILKGKILTDVTTSLDEMIFYVNDGSIYKLYHEQDCCECVTISDINGDINDLIGTEILMCDESVNPEFIPEEEYDSCDSVTWTFYRFATIKGYVDVRWVGYSNGYYSESVDFTQVS